MYTSKINLEADESIIFNVRKHWLIITLEILGITLAALLPSLLYGALAPTMNEMFVLIAPYTSYLLPLYTIWLIFLWITLFSVWTNYYLDVWTLTSKRLVAADQRGLFSRTTSSFRLERLQDVSVSIHGFIPTMLNFGTLEIQTAGQEANFRVHGLPDPEGLKTQILEVAGKANTPTSIL